LKDAGVMQLATLKTAYKTYEEAQDIDLTDPAIVVFIGALAQFGLLDGPERPARIISGYPPE
jgi:hypothetical protein